MIEVETMHRPWTFFRDNAKDWIRMVGADVYLCAPYDGPFDMAQFPWHLAVEGGEAAGFINSMPSGLHFNATDITTGIRYRWTIDICPRGASGNERLSMDAGRIMDIMRNLGSECRAKVVGTLREAIKKIDEDIAGAERWRTICLTNKCIIESAIGGDA